MLLSYYVSGTTLCRKTESGLLGFLWTGVYIRERDGVFFQYGSLAFRIFVVGKPNLM